MENVNALAAIVGIVNGFQLFQTNRTGFIYFCIALGVGLLLGFVNFFGLTPETGLLAALASSGYYKVAQKIGGQ